MKRLTPKQWTVALLVSFLITGSLWALAMTYFLYLPGFSAVAVHKEDRSVVVELYTIATNAFLIALLSGLVLGICLPLAYRWSRKRRIELMGASNAEPCAPPNGGPARPVGDSGVMEGPPSVS
jgi:hypothetical protein